MTAHPYVRRAFTAIALPLTLAFAACSDDPADVDVSDFDPDATADRLDEVLTSADFESDAFLSLNLAQNTVNGFGGGELALVPDLMADRPDYTAVTQAAAADTTIPDSVRGRTYVYDVDTDEYVHDPDRTGAPADGVRFIYYTVSPVTGLPVEPLVELGRIDLRDLGGSAEGVAHLDILIVEDAGGTPVTLADYFVRVVGAFTQEGITVTATSEGFISDGTKTLEFDLMDALTLGQDGISATRDLVFRLPGEVTVRLLGDGSSDGETENVHFVLSITHGGRTTSLDITSDGTNIEGVVRYRGVVVVDIAGTHEEPEFTRRDGEPLTPENIAALQRLADALDRVLEFAGGLFGEEQLAA